MELYDPSTRHQTTTILIASYLARFAGNLVRPTVRDVTDSVQILEAAARDPGVATE